MIELEEVIDEKVPMLQATIRQKDKEFRKMKKAFREEQDRNAELEIKYEELVRRKNKIKSS